MNTPFTAGQSLGRYELLLPLGTGGMAQVWAARLRGTRGFQKTVALKTILTDALERSRMEQMFLEEATLASQIHHPNVVGTLELGEHEGTLYLVMEWVHGESLSSLLRAAAAHGGLPLPIAVNLIAQAGRGLHAAHELCDESGNLLGLVHRDISAQNVLVTYTGTAKLVDFGIAKVTARSSALTVEGEVKGKFAYMSPEQVSGQPIDRRADIFGMGVLLYVATTGHHPFRGENPAATVRNICSKQPPVAPTQLVPGYPSQLEAVVMRALRKSADERFATARDLVIALEAVAADTLEGSLESQVSDYLARLFGTRPQERMNELRLAQQFADQQRSESLHSAHSSVSSLRAVTVPVDSGAADDPLQPQAPASQESVLAPPSVPVASRAARPRSAVFAAGAVVACGLLLFGILRSARDTTTTQVGSASLPSASERSSLLPQSPPPQGPPPQSPPPASTQQMSSGSAADSSARPSDEPRLRAIPRSTARGTRLVAPTTPSTRTATEVANPPASTSTVTPERPRAGATDTKKLNAWDEKNYGGRR
ncbi:MAG TPA: serine/threonine-protein kinase [Polyangiaceae bacterium]|nr:serine/threonine-protein kinase [Polyangiaceae bacterium]